LENAVAVHKAAVRLYGQLRHKALEERPRLLLDEMIRHEERLAELLGDFIARADAESLDTRIQYTLEKRPETFLEEAEAEVTPDLGSLTRLSQTIHSYLVNLFEEAVRETEPDRGAQLMRDILEVEQAERENFSRISLSALDI
jgi:hypothetical protein